MIESQTAVYCKICGKRQIAKLEAEDSVELECLKDDLKEYYICSECYKNASHEEICDVLDIPEGV